MCCTRSGCHRAPSHVPHLRLSRGLKPSSSVQDCWELEEIPLRGNLPSSEPGPQSRRLDLSHGRLQPPVHTWQLPVPRATRHRPSQGWHLANGLKGQAVASQHSSHRSEIQCDPKNCRLKGRGMSQLTDYRRINVTGLPSLLSGDAAICNYKEDRERKHCSTV